MEANAFMAPFAITTDVSSPPLLVGQPPYLITCLSGLKIPTGKPRVGPNYNLSPQSLEWYQLQPSCMTAFRYPPFIEGPHLTPTDAIEPNRTWSPHYVR